jgi:hypothetical protein
MFEQRTSMPICLVYWDENNVDGSPCQGNLPFDCCVHADLLTLLISCDVKRSIVLPARSDLHSGPGFSSNKIQFSSNSFKLSVLLTDIAQSVKNNELTENQKPDTLSRSSLSYLPACIDPSFHRTWRTTLCVKLFRKVDGDYYVLHF